MPQAAAEPIHAAASVVLWRETAQGPQILMGQRRAAAVFMPSKYVFPGGRVDPGDWADPAHLGPECLRRLALCPLDGTPEPPAILGAALRELTEETGLVVRARSSGARSSGALRFIFRAITPTGRTRRFDARFFLVSAAEVAGDPDEFSAASDELSHLHWIGLQAARGLDLPFITEVVIAEAASLLAGIPQLGAPFFDNSGPEPRFRRLD